jgi:uncharacterized protein
MQDALIGFIDVLRSQQLGISTAETLDAMQVTATLGYADPNLLEQGLALALAKSAAEKAVFHQWFGHYFRNRSAASPIQPDAHPAEPGPTTPATLPPGSALTLARNALRDAAVGDPALTALLAQRLPALLMQDNPDRVQLALHQAAAAENLDRMQVFTQRGMFTRRLLEAMGENALREVANYLEGREPALLEALRTLQAALREQVREHVVHNELLHLSGRQQQRLDALLQEVRLNHIERYHRERMVALIQRLALRLAARHSRRSRRSQRGVPDLRRSLRRAAAWDGLLLNPSWRKIKRDRPQILALCDVSGSVAAHAKFLLLFLHSLGDLLPQVRSFVFASRLGEVTELFRELPAEQAVEQAHWRFGGSTDYGRSLADFSTLALDAVNQRTTVLILGDARNNFGDPRTALLRQISERARHVIWLNPESRYAWGSGDSEMLRYMPYCRLVAPCSNLAQLERAVDQVLRCTT